MASLTIRNLDEAVKQRLRVRTAEHGRSMEEEARAIRRTAVGEPAPARSLGRAIHERFAAVGGVIGRGFFGRRLPFDSAAAGACAEIVAVRRAAGRPIMVADCQIAAIAACRGFAVATRNVPDFTDCGSAVIDPWQPATIVR